MEVHHRVGVVEGVAVENEDVAGFHLRNHNLELLGQPLHSVWLPARLTAHLDMVDSPDSVRSFEYLHHHHHSRWLKQAHAAPAMMCRFRVGQVAGAYRQRSVLLRCLVHGDKAAGQIWPQVAVVPIALRQVTATAAAAGSRKHIRVMMARDERLSQAKGGRKGPHNCYRGTRRWEEL